MRSFLSCERPLTLMSFKGKDIMSAFIECSNCQITSQLRHVSYTTYTKVKGKKGHVHTSPRYASGVVQMQMLYRKGLSESKEKDLPHNELTPQLLETYNYLRKLPCSMPWCQRGHSIEAQTDWWNSKRNCDGIWGVFCYSHISLPWTYNNSKRDATKTTEGKQVVPYGGKWCPNHKQRYWSLNCIEQVPGHQIMWKAILRMNRDLYYNKINHKCCVACCRVNNQNVSQGTVGGRESWLIPSNLGADCWWELKWEYFGDYLGGALSGPINHWHLKKFRHIIQN